MSVRVLQDSGGYFVGMYPQNAHTALFNVELNVCDVMQKNVIVVVIVIPWVELRSYSATPNADGDRGDPVPYQAYTKKGENVHLYSNTPFFSPYQISWI